MAPVLKYLDPTTGQYLPILQASTGGGGGTGVNEVSIGAVAPSDGSELWLDTTDGVLHYLDDGAYVPITGSTVEGGSVGAGAGLTGGGTVASNPTLNVGAGSGISVAADSVAVNRSTTDAWYSAKQGQTGLTVDDWNTDAIENGIIYRASGAANAPDTGWWMGMCFSHDGNYKVQILTPFANSRWTTGQLWWREKENGTWGDWNRATTYVFSRDALDPGTFAQHNGTGSSVGVRRSFWGVVKDKATNNASNADAWRVTYYNTSGSYTGQAITIPLGTGVVSMPQTFLRAEELDGSQPVNRGRAMTADSVVRLIIKALARKGLDLDPTELLDLIDDRDDGPPVG